MGLRGVILLGEASMVNERLLVGGGGGGTLCDMAGESVREVCFYVRRGSLSLCCWSGGVMCFAGKVGNRVEEGTKGLAFTGGGHGGWLASLWWREVLFLFLTQLAGVQSSQTSLLWHVSQ